MIPTHAALLTEAQVERIHQASLEILAEVGLLVRNEKARRRFATHGCKVDEDSQVVKIPPAVTERYRALVPSTFTFRGRDPAFDRTLPDDAPVIATASSAPYVHDLMSGERRSATSADVARIAHLVNELDGFDVFSISTLAGDAPEGQFSLSRFYPALKNTVKPVRTSVLDCHEAEQVLQLGELIAGGKEAYWERPFITFGACNIVSPLTMDFDSTEMWMFYAEREIAIYGAVAPITGLSMPMSLAGTLALTNAEWLAQALLAQMSREATPMIYIHLPVVADMRSGAYAAGGIETGMLEAALTQMARFYGVPSGGYMGQTNAKVTDAQAGYEKGMNTLAAVLAGTDYLVMGGLLDALLTFDFGQAVIDNEIALMLKRVHRGIEFSEANLALPEIKAAGPGGMYVDHPETLARMKTTAFLPEVANREVRDSWLEGGGLDAHACALARAREILSEKNDAVFAPEVDRRIRAAFEGLVAGDAEPPAGVVAAAPAAARGRRVNRRRRRA
jgi:trimethylamine--corrinoid protein Co-methyltransferase